MGSGTECKPDELTYNNDLLPPEVLGCIFSYLCLKDRNNIRFVCKSWHNEGSRTANLRISLMNRETARYLENCGYARLNLRFLNLWATRGSLIRFSEKVAAKLRSLEFINCRYVHFSMEDILRYDNLKRLHLNFSKGDRFWPVEMLESLTTVHRTLDTLQISRKNCENLANGERIFSSLLRVFPNIIHFSTYCRVMPVRTKFACKFSLLKERDETVNTSKLASSLAFSLSADADDWWKALDSLSALRLTSFSLQFLKRQYVQADETALFNFFVDHKELRSIVLELEDKIDVDKFKSLLLLMVDCCRELRELQYFTNGDQNLLKSYKLTADELSQFLQRASNFECLSINWLTVRSLRMHCRFLLDSTLLVQNYALLEHLHLFRSVSDEILQSIFQYMTNLKTLEMILGAVNTAFGLTGRRGKVPEDAVQGYSINRLQNLEGLKIFGDGESMPDDVFHEFDFPKLVRLKCFPPKELRTYALLAKKLPSLKELNFSPQIIFLQNLLMFCRFSKSIHTVHFFYTSQFDSNLNAPVIFEKCPSLRYIHVPSHTYYIDPFTMESFKTRFPRAN